MAQGEFRLGPAVREERMRLHTGGEVDVHAPIPGSEEDDPQKAMEALRPELYQRAGILIPEITRVLTGAEGLPRQFPPYGLFDAQRINDEETGQTKVIRTPKSAFQNFTDLYTSMCQSTRIYTHNAKFPAEYQSTEERLEVLVARAQELDPKDPRYESSERFLEAGINTALEFSMGAAIGIDAKIYNERRYTQQEDFVRIVQRSHKLVTGLMFQNIGHLAPIRAILKTPLHEGDSVDDVNCTPCINPNLLTFRPHRDDPDCYLDYVIPVEEMLDPRSGKKIGQLPLRFKTLFCPAAASASTKELLTWCATTVGDVFYNNKPKVQ